MMTMRSTKSLKKKQNDIRSDKWLADAVFYRFKNGMSKYTCNRKLSRKTY